MISFKATWAEHKIIALIVQRALEIAKGHEIEIDALTLNMDITACHANGCPLDLDKLCGAPDLDFIHDVFGIHNHIDRETGQLTDCFLPRCAKPRTAAAHECDGCTPDTPGIRPYSNTDAPHAGPPPEGFVVVERCDTCEKYPDDLAAAAAWGTDARWQEGNGTAQAICRPPARNS